MKIRNLLCIAIRLTIMTIAIGALGQQSFGQHSLTGQLSKLRSQTDSSETIDEILQSTPDSADLVTAIRSGVAADPDEQRKGKLVAGWSEWSATDVHGTTRPYQLYLPQGVVGGDAVEAVIVHIHGAVARPDFGTGLGSPMATGYGGMLWPKLAEAENLVVVCPQGREECAWWTDNGLGHVDAVLRDVRRSLDFPEASIIGAGFSDGASGCYFRAMVKPDPFAGFIALNGHPRVASSSGKQVYLPNMAMTETIAAMTQKDSLYPSRIILPHMLIAIQNGANILTLSYPKMNHQPLYFQDQTAAILKFVKTTKRSRADKVRWYAATAEIGACQWLELLEFASKEDAVPVEEFNVMSAPRSVRIGSRFDPKSLAVVELSEDSAGANAGLQVGDQLLEFDGEEVTGSRALSGMLANKSYEEAFTMKVKRGDELVDLNGTFPPFVSEPIYLRDLPTGWAECQIQPDRDVPVVLHTKNVTRVRIGLPDDLAKMEAVKVNVNEKVVSLPVTRRTAKEILIAFAATADSERVDAAYLEVDVPQESSEAAE